MRQFLAVVTVIGMLGVQLADARPGDAQRAASTVRDSAGIRIVSHARTARAQSTWRIAPQPLLEIGGDNAAGPMLFDDIWGAARTVRGEIIVSDNATQQLRMFGATGQHLRTFGRRGEGPGEFGQIKRVYVRGDSVLALDTYRGTAVFTLNGTLVRQRQHPLLSGYSAVSAWGVLADGSVIETAEGPAPYNRSNFVGTFTEMRGLIRISPDGRSATLLREVPTYDYHRKSNDPPGGDLITFSPTLSVAVTENRVCFGRGATYEIQCSNSAGALTMIVRRDMPPSPVTARAKAAYRQKVRTQEPTPEHNAMPQARLDVIAANVHFAATFPTYDRIVAGANGELWVSDYSYASHTRANGEPAPRGDITRWNVFARDGTWSAVITLPTRFSIRQVGADFLLGVSRDDDDVERVTLYKLMHGR